LKNDPEQLKATTLGTVLVYGRGGVLRPIVRSAPRFIEYGSYRVSNAQGVAAEAIRAPIWYLSNNGIQITISIMEKRIRLTRTESHAQTRERLLVAARQVFARYGFGGASVDMIAADAGYSKGAIYSNFETKEAILFELLERYAEKQIADFKAIMQLDPEVTRDAYNNWLDTMNADMDWDVVTMELQLHARRNPEFAERFYALEERLTSFYADIIAELFARAGRKPPLDPRSLSLAFRTLACGLNLKIPRSMPGRANEAGRIIHELIDLMLEPDSVTSDSALRKTKGKTGTPQDGVLPRRRRIASKKG
jgi:AcrR family transcriptional regulator